MRTRTQPAEHAASGFTLLEVLVAMAIVGLAVSSMMYLLSGSVSNLRRVQAVSELQLRARQQMNQLLVFDQPAVLLAAGGDAAVPGKQSGRWDDLARWEATASPLRTTAVNTPVVPVRVVLEVWWKRDAGSAERHFALETIQLRRPAQAAAGS